MSDLPLSVRNRNRDSNLAAEPANTGVLGVNPTTINREEKLTGIVLKPGPDPTPDDTPLAGRPFGMGDGSKGGATKKPPKRTTGGVAPPRISNKAPSAKLLNRDDVLGAARSLLGG